MAVSVIEPIITVCAESARILSRPNYHREFHFDVNAAQEFADESGWTGFAFVFGVDGPLSVPGRYLFGNVCEHIRDTVNAETAFKIMADAVGEPRDADGNGGYVVTEWHGYMAYDHGNPLAEQAAHRITTALGDGCLDTVEASDRERANGIAGLIDSYHVPESLVESVFDLMPDFSGCFECVSPDVDRAMDELGYVQCADCYDWIKSGGKSGEILCHDCADSRGDCECVSIVVETHRHGGHVTTAQDVEDACSGECAEDSDGE